MSYIIRRLVSRHKRRYQKDGFDLDLSYITNRLIAMGWPSTGKTEGLYRNSMSETRRLLDAYHLGHYRVYNLCSEKDYDPEVVNGSVVRFPVDDHQPPTLAQMLAFCEDVDAFLELHPDNVAAVHCKAGKGRTGTMICAYLVYKGLFETSDEALDFYAEMRMLNNRGVTIASQRRYVHYFAAMRPGGGGAAGGAPVLDPALALPPIVPRRPARIRLRQLWITGLADKEMSKVVIALWVRSSDRQTASPLVVIAAQGGKMKVGKLRGVPGRAMSDIPKLRISGGAAVIVFPDQVDANGQSDPGSWVIEGDVRVQVFQGSAEPDASLFYTWFNTGFLEGTRYAVTRQDLDKVKSSVPENAGIEVLFDPVSEEEEASSALLGASTPSGAKSALQRLGSLQMATEGLPYALDLGRESSRLDLGRPSMDLSRASSGLYLGRPSCSLNIARASSRGSFSIDRGPPDTSSGLAVFWSKWFPMLGDNPRPSTPTLISASWDSLVDLPFQRRASNTFYRATA